MIEIKPGQIWRKKNKRGPDTVRTVVSVAPQPWYRMGVLYMQPDSSRLLSCALSAFSRWAQKATLEVRL